MNPHNQEILIIAAEKVGNAAERTAEVIRWFLIREDRRREQALPALDRVNDRGTPP